MTYCMQQATVTAVPRGREPSAAALLRGRMTGFGVQQQAFSLEYPLGFEIVQRFGTMTVVEAASGKSPLGTS